MKTRMRLLAALCLLAGAPADSSETGEAPEPFHLGLEGRLFLSHGSNPHPSEWRTTGENIAGWLAVPARFHRVEAKLSLGGLLNLHSPASEDGGWNSYRTGGIEFDEAYLRLPFAPFDFPSSLTAGRFRVKTDPDAILAGEYLMRYSAYPTGPARQARPWDALDSLTTPVFGARLSVAAPEGSWRQSVMVLADSGWGGVDISLGYTLDVKPVRGLEFGLGAEGYRMASPFGSPVTAPARAGFGTDTAGRNFYDRSSGDSIKADSTQVISFEAVLFSMRAALDLKAMVSGAENPGRDWSMFAEAAVLGWKNYPIFYPRRMDRTALMAGMHLPSFGLLDAFCLQWETYPSDPWPGLSALFRSPRPIGWVSSPAQDSASAPPDIRDWRFVLFVSRQAAPWLAMQGWISYADEDPLEGIAPAANVYSGHGWTYELRLTARY